MVKPRLKFFKGSQNWRNFCDSIFKTYFTPIHRSIYETAPRSRTDSLLLTSSTRICIRQWIRAQLYSLLTDKRIPHDLLRTESSCAWFPNLHSTPAKWKIIKSSYFFTVLQDYQKLKLTSIFFLILRRNLFPT